MNNDFRIHSRIADKNHLIQEETTKDSTKIGHKFSKESQGSDAADKMASPIFQEKFQDFNEEREIDHHTFSDESIPSCAEDVNRTISSDSENSTSPFFQKSSATQTSEFEDTQEIESFDSLEEEEESVDLDLDLDGLDDKKDAVLTKKEKSIENLTDFKELEVSVSLDKVENIETKTTGINEETQSQKIIDSMAELIVQSHRKMMSEANLTCSNTPLIKQLAKDEVETLVAVKKESGEEASFTKEDLAIIGDNTWKKAVKAKILLEVNSDGHLVPLSEERSEELRVKFKNALFEEFNRQGWVFAPSKTNIAESEESKKMEKKEQGLQKQGSEKSHETLASPLFKATPFTLETPQSSRISHLIISLITSTALVKFLNDKREQQKSEQANKLQDRIIREEVLKFDLKQTNIKRDSLKIINGLFDDHKRTLQSILVSS